MVVDGGANDGASSIQVTPNEVINYKLVARIAPVGTTNSTNGQTINSLSTSPTDGITQIRFNIQERSTDEIQADFSSGVELQNGFNLAEFSSTGTVDARTGTAEHNLDAVKAIQPFGTFVGVTSANTPSDVILATGSFTVKSLGRGLPSSIFMSYNNPDQAPGAFKINGGQGVEPLKTDTDPILTFTGLTLTSAPSSTISGRVFNDTNADGLFDGSDVGISGFRVFLDQDNNGILDAGEISKPVSATGTYTFSNVPAGTYRVREVFRSGWRQTYPALGYYQLTIGDGEKAKSLSFANTDTVLIKGTVWMDANKNKKFDSSEGGLPGWSLYLDQNNNGVLDAGETSTVTDANGNYRFFNLPAGKYVVRVMQASSKYRLTAPASGTHILTLAAAGTRSNQNFGEKRLT